MNPIATTAGTPTPKTPTLTLDEAVERMVAVLVGKNYSFSVHDITKLLREAANMKAVELEGLPKTLQIQIGPITQSTVDINHQSIRSCVHKLWEDQKLPNYERELKQSDRAPRKFWEYKPKSQGASAPGSLQSLKN